MHHCLATRLAFSLVALLAVGCSEPIKTVTLKGKLRPPSSEGVAGAPAHPSIANTPLLVTNLSGTLAKPEAARIHNSAGDFGFELRTDNLPVAGDFVKVAWQHPTRGGLMLERTYSLSRNQTGDIPGDLTDLSTLVTLGLEALRQTQPGRTVAPPTLLEDQLISASSVRGRFQSRYYGYLAGSEPAPGSDADLAQDSSDILFD